MKYLKIAPFGLFQTDEISKRDLGDIKTKDLRWLVDVENETYFDAEKNKWVKIKVI